MAITVDFNNVVSVLNSAGYKAIKEEADKALSLGITFSATFSSVTLSHPAIKKGSVTWESVTSLTSLSKNLSNKVIITPFVTALHKFLVTVNEHVANSPAATPKPNIGIDTAKGTDTSIVSKLKLPTEIEEDNYFTGKTIDAVEQGKKREKLEPLVKKTAFKPKESHLFVDAGKFPIDVYSDDMVNLTKADTLMQPVKGSSKTSTYYYIGVGMTALGSPVKIALRIKEPSEGVWVASLRLEGAGIKELNSELKDHGFSMTEGSHASLHYTLDKLGVIRSLVAIIYALPVQLYQTAKVY